MISSLNDSTFDLAVSNVPGLHVVRFWAEWCGPCRVMAPVFKEVAQDMQNDAHFAEVDIVAAPESASRFRVQSIPTTLLFRDGKVVSNLVGATSRSNLALFIQRNLTKR